MGTPNSALPSTSSVSTRQLRSSTPQIPQGRKTWTLSTLLRSPYTSGLPNGPQNTHQNLRFSNDLHRPSLVHRQFYRSPVLHRYSTNPHRFQGSHNDHHRSNIRQAFSKLFRPTAHQRHHRFTAHVEADHQRPWPRSLTRLSS